MPAFCGLSWRMGKTISWRHRVRFIISRAVRTPQMDEHLTTGCEEDAVRDTGNDRHSGNPLPPQVQRETVARMAPECTHDHQGQSQSAHQQAEYRRAVHSTLLITSNTLAPPGESI